MQRYLRLKINSNWINAKNIAHNLKNKTNAIKFYNSKNFDNIKMYRNNSVKINNIISNLDDFIETSLNTARNDHHETRDDNRKDFTDFFTIIDLLQNLYPSKNIDFNLNINRKKKYVIKGEK